MERKIPTPPLIIISCSLNHGITMSSLDVTSTPDAPLILALLEEAAKKEADDDNDMPFLYAMLHAMHKLQGGGAPAFSTLISDEQRAKLLAIRDWGSWDEHTNSVTPYLACVMVCGGFREDIKPYLNQ